MTIRGREIGIFNLAGAFFALRNRCPHQGGALCRGEITGLVTSPTPGTYAYERPGEMLKCPWHGWEFDLRTGQSYCDPESTWARAYAVTVEPGAALARGPLVAETFPVAVEENYIVVEL